MFRKTKLRVWPLLSKEGADFLVSPSLSPAQPDNKLERIFPASLYLPDYCLEISFSVLNKDCQKMRGL